MGHFPLVVPWNQAKPLSLAVSDIFNVECNAMVDITLIRRLRPLNKGQGGSLWLVRIDFSYTTSYRLSTVTFALGRTVQPQYIPYRQRQTDGRNPLA